MFMFSILQGMGKTTLNVLCFLLELNAMITYCNELEEVIRLTAILSSQFW